MPPIVVCSSSRGSTIKRSPRGVKFIPSYLPWMTQACNSLVTVIGTLRSRVPDEPSIADALGRRARTRVPWRDATFSPAASVCVGSRASGGSRSFAPREARPARGCCPKVSSSRARQRASRPARDRGGDGRQRSAARGRRLGNVLVTAARASGYSSSCRSSSPTRRSARTAAPRSRVTRSPRPPGSPRRTPRSESRTRASRRWPGERSDTRRRPERMILSPVPSFALNFYSPVVEAQLRSHRKTATIRLGDKSRKYQKGMIVAVLVGRVTAPASTSSTP